VAPAKLGGKWCLIDKTGKVLVESQFDEIQDFKDGVACVVISGTKNQCDRQVGGKVGLIDKTGKLLVEPQFDEIQDFKDGVARVVIGSTKNQYNRQVGGKVGLIDKTGKLLVEPQFDEIQDFKDGVARVVRGGTQEDQYEPAFRENWGFIDKTGKVLLKPQFQFSQISDFKDGVACIATGGTRNQHGMRVGVNWGIIDKKGDWVVIPQFIERPDCYYGKFFGGNLEKGGKYFISDTSGNIIWKEGDNKERPKASSGTGFYVSTEGHVITNYHVVKNFSKFSVNGIPAELINYDSANDLALLIAKATPLAIAVFNTNNPVRLGEEVFSFGFPLSGLLSSGGNLTSGTISGLSGIENNANHLQITAAIQAGNSGGPLINRKGLIVGLVFGKLNAFYTAKLTGTLPENVNFAIRSEVVRSFLELNNVSCKREGWFCFSKSNEDIAAEVQKYTVKVECSR